MNKPTRERIAELREWAEETLEEHRLECDSMWLKEDTQAEADLLAILDQAEALPELVEACRELWPDDCHQPESLRPRSEVAHIVDKARAALAKIEGKP